MREERPIEFILPAFPAKSPNPQKTLGHLPDYGEVLGLRRLNELCARIGEVYAHGASVAICSDGRVFSDLVGVADAAVDEYASQIRRIIEENHFTHLTTFCLEDVVDGASSFTAMREWLTERYASPIEELRRRIRTDEESRSMFNGIHRFLLEDQLALHPELSKNKLRSRAKQLSYGVIQRSNAWSALLEETFPSAVRLSIHPQLGSSKKLGIRLLPSTDIWRTPWHSVPLYDGTDYRLVSRRQAEELGGVVVHMQDKYPCYVLP
jgi:pyoverdine/dityrosine biosynthesis protein Dit1